MGFENTLVQLISGKTGDVFKSNTLVYPHDIETIESGNRHVKLIVKENNNFCKSVIDNSTNSMLKSADDSAKLIDTILNGETVSAPEKVKLTESGNTVFVFSLALPNELSDSQRHNWSTSDSLVAEIGKKLTGNIAYKAYSEAASNAAYRKLTLDPGYFQDYKGTQPRDISFSFTLMPNNHAEAMAIQKIIYKLKQYTLPETQVNMLALRSPYYFELEFGNKIIDQMMCLKHVVCTGMSVNYGADGNMQFFSNGMPKVLTLSLSFVERQTMTSNMYKTELLFPGYKGEDAGSSVNSMINSGKEAASSAIDKIKKNDGVIN